MTIRRNTDGFHLYSFVFCYFLYIVFYDVTLLYFICSIVIRVRIKGDDDIFTSVATVHYIISILAMACESIQAYTVVSSTVHPSGGPEWIEDTSSFAGRWQQLTERKSLLHQNHDSFHHGRPTHT